jgi:hypothetical protein
MEKLPWETGGRVVHRLRPCDVANGWRPPQEAVTTGAKPKVIRSMPSSAWIHVSSTASLLIRPDLCVPYNIHILTHAPLLQPELIRNFYGIASFMSFGVPDGANPANLAFHLAAAFLDTFTATDLRTAQAPELT